MKIDYTGMKINRLTVRKYVDLRSPGAKKAKWMWECDCECGNTTYLRTYEITLGKRKSCGCFMKDFNRKNNTLPNNLGPKRELFRSYRYSAEKRVLIFTLTEKQFYKLITNNCYYCNLPPQNSNNGKHIKGFKYNGIDRVDNNIGYSLDNSVTCCHKCNDSKKDYPIEDWFVWIHKLFNFQLQKGTFNDYPEREYAQVSGNREDPTK